eukprot:scaffold55315_cov29-Tisochrysis_lutea.AAC.4
MESPTLRSMCCARRLGCIDVAHGCGGPTPAMPATKPGDIGWIAVGALVRPLRLSTSTAPYLAAGAAPPALTPVEASSAEATAADASVSAAAKTPVRNIASCTASPAAQQFLSTRRISVKAVAAAASRRGGPGEAEMKAPNTVIWPRAHGLLSSRQCPSLSEASTDAPPTPSLRVNSTGKEPRSIAAACGATVRASFSRTVGASRDSTTTAGRISTSRLQSDAVNAVSRASN